MPAAVAAGIFCPGCDHIHCSARVKCALRHPLFQYAHPPQRQARARRDLRQLRLADWNPRRRGSTRRTGTQWARRAPCDKTRDISPTTLSNVRQTPRDDRLSGRQIWTPCPQLETKVAGALHQVETTPKKCPFAWRQRQIGQEAQPLSTKLHSGDRRRRAAAATLLPCADSVPPGLKGPKLRRARRGGRV